MGKAKEKIVSYWITSVQSKKGQTAVDTIQRLVGQESVFAFSDRGTIKSSLEPDDWICFFASAKGVVAHSKVVTVPERREHVHVDHTKYPWVVRLQDISLYLDNPVVLDARLRGRLDAFSHRAPTGRWSWFVQQTRRISRHDFQMLTRQI